MTLPTPTIPTIGRIVHYFDGARGRFFAAIVTDVNKDETLCLTIFYPFGQHIEPRVLPAPNYSGDGWAWPPGMTR